MFKIAEILSSTYKIEHFSRFLGQNTYFKHVFGHFKPILYGVYMQKNTFFEGTKKIFCAKKFLGLFVHVQRWLVQKNNTGSYNY